MRIRPTLFVGLGTSGVEIIAHFRRMMYEQFTRAGLPCFQYIGIETNADAKPPDEDYRFDEYGRIDFLRTTVDNMPAVRVYLDDTRPEFLPDLKRWLDPSLLINENAVEKGANHVRMLGRLALWKNWDRVQTALSNAFANLGDDKRRTHSEHILKDRLPDQDPPPRVSPGCNVFMLGTLCGGTCGGMLIDIAYQVRAILSAGSVQLPPGTNPNIYAIVTVLDDVLSKQQDRARQAANCWASLLELDHYMDNRTHYDYSMPGAAQFARTHEPPVTFVQLVSRSNILGELFPGSVENFKGDELNRMIALKIFNNIFTEVDISIETEMVNLIAQGSQQRNLKQRTRTMISFGVSAMWNPKYKFAEAFACDKAIRFCEDLIGSLSAGRDGLMQRIARDRWRGVVRDAGESLYHPRGRDSIPERINALIQDVDKKTSKIPLNEMVEFLNAYPRDNPLRARFKLRGELVKDMKDMVDVFSSELRNRVKAFVEDLIRDMDPLNQDHHAETVLNVSEMALFVQKLREIVTEDAEAAAENLPTFEFRGSPLPRGIDLIGNPWQALIFKSSSSETKIRSRIIKEFREYADLFRRQCAMHFARKPILRMRESLIEEIARKINDIKLLLEDTVVELKKQRDAADTRQGVHYSNTWELPQPGYSAFLTERYDHLELGRKRDLVTQILRNLADDEQDVRQQTWNGLVTRSPEDLTGIFKYPFFRWALEQRTEWSIAEEATKRFQSPEDIRPVVRRSFPFCRMKGDYQSSRKTIHSTLERLCGKSIPGKLKDLANRSESEQKPFEISDSSLDNLVVFYRQEAPFHIDDLAAAPHMLQRYTDIMESNAKPIHAEIDPTTFDKGHLDRLADIQDMVDTIQLLYPDEAFARYGPNLVFQYTRPNGRSEAIAVTTEQDKQRFCTRLARQETESTQAREAFEERVKEILRSRGREAVMQRANEIYGKWLAELGEDDRKNRDAKLSKFFDTFLPHDPAASIDTAPPANT